LKNKEKILSSHQPLPIDQMPNLAKQLGKARTDRIRYTQTGKYQKEACATNLTNTVLHLMQYYQPTDYGCKINDTIQGVASLDHQASGQSRPMPLNSARLYNIFQCMPIINSREIGLMMNIEKRQAQRYMRAAKILLPLLERILIEKPKQEE